MALTPGAEAITAVALPAAFTAAGLILGLLLQSLLLPRRPRSGERSWVNDILIAVLRGPVALWCAIAGLSWRPRC